MMDPTRQFPNAKETANLLWFDSLVRHQIYVLRYSGSVRNDIIELLNKTEKDIEGKIRASLAGDRKLSPSRLRKGKSLIASIKAVRNGAWDAADAELYASMKEFVGKEASFLGTTLEAVVPVELAPALPSRATLRALVREHPFEGRILSSWAKTLRASDLRRIDDAIQIGIVQGESSAAIARRVVGTKAMNGVDGALQTTRRHVQAVTRTAVTSYSNAARTSFFQANSDLFDKEIFVATLDGRTTAICRSYDGEKFPIAEGPQPPLHFQCRSLRVASISKDAIGNRPARPITERQMLREYTNGKVGSYKDLPYGTKTKYNAFRARRLREVTGQVPAKVTYNDWLRRQPVEFQNDVLGPTRGKLFRDGKLPLGRFVNRAGDELTLARLASREAAAFKAAGLDPTAY